MAVLIFAADIGFIHFHDAAEFVHVLFNKRRADLVAHEPRGFVGTEAHVAHDLQCAHALFAGQHKVNDLKPLPQRLVGVLKDRARNVGEAIARRLATLVALPVQRIALQFGNVSAAARAFNAFRPAPPDQIGAASVLVREHALEVGGGKLVDRLRSAGHRNISPLGRMRMPCPI